MRLILFILISSLLYLFIKHNKASFKKFELKNNSKRKKVNDIIMLNSNQVNQLQSNSKEFEEIDLN